LKYEYSGRDHRAEIGFELNGHNNEQSTSVACGSIACGGVPIGICPNMVNPQWKGINYIVRSYATLACSILGLAHSLPI
jgi:hypothetical protein